ncbi:MAG: hypothetical protein HGA47_15305 [Zoogloea sp.]|nr:hypothetical protein [Zoogloea sp.]
MTIQSAELRKCTTCNRWGGSRKPGPEPGTVELDPANDRGPCQEGPWHGNLRGPRNACGQWIRWIALDASPAPPG